MKILTEYEELIKDEPLIVVTRTIDNRSLYVNGVLIENAKSLLKVIRELHINNQKLKKQLKLYKHRLDVANNYIESRKENMIPEHYDDLKYIINNCDKESTW